MAQGEYISIRLGGATYRAVVTAATAPILTAHALTGPLVFLSLDAGATWRLVRVETGGAP